MTRFEMIKFADSPEELATILNLMFNCKTCPNDAFSINPNDPSENDCLGDCYNCWLDILKNPVVIRKSCHSCEFKYKCHNNKGDMK